MCPLSKILTSALLCGFVIADAAHAQQPRTAFPLDHRVPAGKAAHWNVLARPNIFGYPQPVRISVPGTAQVTYYSGESPDGVTVDSSLPARLPVGFAYRARISDMSQYPGLELFPTVEVLDRLHPPADMVDQFAIPIEITEEEIEAVLDDRMVTKVIYLERQDLPRPSYLPRENVPLTELLPSENLLESATNMGRPVAILRLGGRTLAPGERHLLSAPPVPLSVTQSMRPGQ